MQKILTIARFTFLEAISNKVLHTVLLFILILIGASAIYGSVSIADTSHVIKDAGLFGITFFGAVTAAITGVSLFNKDLKQKTIYNILSKPVSRTQYIIGKYLGFCLTVWLLQLLMGIVLLAVVAMYTGRFESELILGLYGTAAEAALISALVIFFSSFSVTPVLPGLFTAAAFLAGHSVGFIRTFATENITNEKLRVVFSAFTNLIPNLSLFNWNAAIVYGKTIAPATIILASCYAVSYAAAVIALSAAVFSKRELN